MILKRIPTALALCLLVAACNGKPEQTSEDTPASPAGPASTTVPLPPYPAWAAPMIGRNLSEITKGAAQCKGAFDGVSARHTGASPGVEVRGWGWDETGAKTPDKLLIADTSGKIVGAGNFGDTRTDVPAAMPEVKTRKAGWIAVAGVTAGDVQAVGLTGSGSSCVLGRFTL